VRICGTSCSIYFLRCISAKLLFRHDFSVDRVLLLTSSSVTVPLVPDAVMATQDVQFPESPPQDSNPPVQTVCLHVVSPGPENRHTFPSLPLTTTIGELKRLIATSTVGQPAPERQRLIFRGRRLAVDTDSLADIFGQLEVWNTPRLSGVLIQVVDSHHL
jgi:hypothetical protein